MPCIQTDIIDKRALFNVTIRPAWAIKDGRIQVTDPKCKFLIDTGSTGCCISKYFAEKIGLKPAGRKPLMGIHGTKQSNVYRSDILIEGIKRGFSNIELLEVYLEADSKYHGLIGMNIIGLGMLHFNYRGNGKQETCTFCI